MAHPQSTPVQLPLFADGKTCRKCKKFKPFAQFRKRRAMRDGHDSHCKSCHCEASKQRRRAVRQLLAEHPEMRRRVSEKRCGHCGVVREPSMFLASASTWDGLTSDCRICRRAANKARGAAAQAVYDARSYRKHGERKRLRRKRWGQAQPHRERTRVAKRRARVRAAPGNFTERDVAALYAAQGGLCYYCGAGLAGTFDVDHKTPLSRGGSNWPDNLCCACDWCNSSKGAKTEAEFRARLSRASPR